MLRRLSRGLGRVAWLCACVASSAAAQPAPAEPTPGEPYRDRVIETMGFDPAAPDAEDDPYDTEGLPRHVRIESRVARESNSLGGRVSSAAVSGFALIDKPNYGVISVDADVRRESGSRGDGAGAFKVGPTRSLPASLTIRQRGLPLGDGRGLDNELGSILAPTPYLARTLSRINLPSPRLQGLASTYVDERRNVSAVAALGEPLQYEGLYASRVQRLPGTVVQLGGQWDAPADESVRRHPLDQRRAPRAWSAAAMLAEGRGLAPFGVYGSAWDRPSQPSLASRFDARSAWAAAGGDGPGVQWQAQALNTQLSGADLGPARGASGGWADFNLNQGSLGHGFGGYLLERGLSWLGLPLAADVAGAYYRGSWQSRLWTADGGIDLLRSLTDGRQGWFVVGGVRRRISSSLYGSINGSMRNFSGRAHRLAGDLQWRHGLGQTDVRTELGGDGDGGASRRITLQHDWDLEPGFALATSVSAGQVKMPQLGTQPQWSAAASLDVPLYRTAVLRGSLVFEQTGDQQRQGTNLSLSWPLSVFWALELGANVQRGQVRGQRSIDPLAPPQPAFAATSSAAQSYFMTLRWERRSGTSITPLGGRPQDGGGTIEGCVFFDTNRNGSLDVGERGVPDVVVQLDGRYTAKTDSQGRYEFPWVARGPREVVVLNDTLPLPWGSLPEDVRNVEVELRRTVRRDIAVVAQ